MRYVAAFSRIVLGSVLWFTGPDRRIPIQLENGSVISSASAGITPSKDVSQRLSVRPRHTQCGTPFTTSVLDRLERALVAPVLASPQCSEGGCQMVHAYQVQNDCMPACGGTYRWHYSNPELSPATSGFRYLAGWRCTSACWICDEEYCSFMKTIFVPVICIVGSS